MDDTLAHPRWHSAPSKAKHHNIWDTSTPQGRDFVPWHNVMQKFEAVEQVRVPDGCTSQRPCSAKDMKKEAAAGYCRSPSAEAPALGRRRPAPGFVPGFELMQHAGAPHFLEHGIEASH
jgi:hypothetical protein